MLAVDTVEQALISLGARIHSRALTPFLTQRIVERKAGPVIRCSLFPISILTQFATCGQACVVRCVILLLALIVGEHLDGGQLLGVV